MKLRNDKNKKNNNKPKLRTVKFEIKETKAPTNGIIVDNLSMLSVLI